MLRITRVRVLTKGLFNRSPNLYKALSSHHDSFMSAIINTMLEPFRFTYAFFESLGDSSWHYTIEVAGNCEDPKVARQKDKYKDVNFDRALA